MPSPSTAAALSELPPPWEIKSKHETIFSVFLLALAFLFRNHPSIQYPRILYVFLIFLAFNLLYHAFLKQKLQSVHLSFSPVFVNGILITWIVNDSGGPASYLWVMYLLPIFTACILFEGWRVWLSTAYVLTLYASVHGEGLWSMDDIDGLQFMGKTALLVLSASVTTRLAATERISRQWTAAQRRAYEESLESLKGAAAVGKPGEAKFSLFGMGVHDVNTALSIILGSAQLISKSKDGDSREDVARVESAVRLGKVILQNLYLIGESDQEWPRQRTSLHPLLEEAFSQCRGEVRAKRLALETVLSAPQDESMANPRLLQQAFVNFLFAAVSSTPVGGVVRVKTRCLIDDGAPAYWEAVIEDGGAAVEEKMRRRFFDPRVPLPGRGKGVGMSLYLGREILERHGARVESSARDEGGNRLLVRLPLAGGGKRSSIAPVRLKGLEN